MANDARDELVKVLYDTITTIGGEAAHRGVDAILANPDVVLRALGGTKYARGLKTRELYPENTLIPPDDRGTSLDMVYVVPLNKEQG